MLFPILRDAKQGLDCLRVEVSLDVLVPGRLPLPSPFVLDTGCEVSMVSEDVAVLLGLPASGRAANVSAVLTGGSGRIVPVRFRYAAIPDVEVDTEWVVVGGQTRLRLLALRDILPHFEIRTLNMNLYLLRK